MKDFEEAPTIELPQVKTPVESKFHYENEPWTDEMWIVRSMN